jgi:hypothetical protein
MKSMRMIVTAIMLAILAEGCFVSSAINRVDYPVPVVPEGYVGIDAYEDGRPKDYVKFFNDGVYPSLVMHVMYHDPKTRNWETYGGAALKGPGDCDTMKHSTHLGGGLKRLRYFAVKFMDGKRHSITTEVRHNDLYIRVGDEVAN